MHSKMRLHIHKHDKQSEVASTDSPASNSACCHALTHNSDINIPALLQFDTTGQHDAHVLRLLRAIDYKISNMLLWRAVGCVIDVVVVDVVEADSLLAPPENCQDPSKCHAKGVS